MDAIDILKWPDGFWCFREELRAEFRRDDDYRVIKAQSLEWLEIASERAVKDIRS